MVGGRQQPPGVRDWLQAMPARHGGTLPGRKPIAFCAWLYGLLGMVPGDELIARFPGPGIVGRAWRFLSSTSDASPLEPCDASSLQVGDASRAADARRASRATTRHARGPHQRVTLEGRLSSGAPRGPIH